MTKTEMRELNRLTNAIKQTMVYVAYMNCSKVIFDNLEETIDDDIDNAFTGIEFSFPEYSCIGDTVTRNCAKSEIYQALEHCKTWRAFDPKFDISGYLKGSITGESVMEDIINMNGDDDEEDGE
jgi:hypothetical protein